MFTPKKQKWDLDKWEIEKGIPEDGDRKHTLGFTAFFNSERSECRCCGKIRRAIGILSVGGNVCLQCSLDPNMIIHHKL